MSLTLGKHWLYFCNETLFRPKRKNRDGSFALKAWGSARIKLHHFFPELNIFWKRRCSMGIQVVCACVCACKIVNWSSFFRVRPYTHQDTQKDTDTDTETKPTNSTKRTLGNSAAWINDGALIACFVCYHFATCTICSNRANQNNAWWRSERKQEHCLPVLRNTYKKKQEADLLEQGTDTPASLVDIQARSNHPAQAQPSALLIRANERI
jgi:hypothetical protein